jgi:hypothetical protein
MSICNNFFYTHCISYYHGNNRPNNIISAFNKLNTYKLSKTQVLSDKILFIVYILYDYLNDKINEIYKPYKLLENEKINVLLLFRYNTGGTIQTMNYVYEYLINNNINTNFISIFEDDAIFKNEYILDTVSNYLNEGYILTGPLFTEENRFGVKKFYPPYAFRANSIVPFCRNYHIYENDNSKELIQDSLYEWVDGCGYFTTFDNLKKIKNKLNKFTLAPQDIRYTHCEHGINFGEVGFCLRLKLNGFKFIGLPASIFYEQLEQNSIGDKTI